MDDVEQCVLSIKKALKPCGRFLTISFASPMLRGPLLKGVFDVKIHSFNSPGTGFEYYLYECALMKNEDDSDFHRYLEPDVSTTAVTYVEIEENDPLSLVDTYFEDDTDYTDS